MNITVEAVQCPMCQGTRQDYSVTSASLVECTLCQGRGWVPVESCRGCGRPAYKFWPPRQIPIIRYCGLEDCFKHLVTLHVSKNPPEKPAMVQVVEKLEEFKHQKELKAQMMGPSLRSNQVM